MKGRYFIGILISMVLACGSLTWAETAQELHAKRDLKETMDAFKKAFELQLRNVEYCLQIARTAVNMKTWHTAETFYG